MELDCGIAGYGRAPCPLSIVEAVRLHGWTASAPIGLESRIRKYNSVRRYGNVRLERIVELESIVELEGVASEHV